MASESKAHLALGLMGYLLRAKQLYRSGSGREGIYSENPGFDQNVVQVQDMTAARELR